MTRKWFPVGLSFSISLLLFYLFYVRFWKWRDCLEQAASSCRTPDGDILIFGGVFWIIPAIFFLIMYAIIFFIPVSTKYRSDR